MTALRIGLVAFSLLVVACAADEADREEHAQPSTPVLALIERDLLEGELPSELQGARALLEANREFDLDTLRALYDFGVAHSDDARPWLMLGYDAANAEIWGFATRYYRRAIGADPRAAYQRTVLEDLLWAVRFYVGAELEEASDLIVASYGEESLGAIDAALSDALSEGDAAGAERLRSLWLQMDGEDVSTGTSGAQPESSEE